MNAWHMFSRRQLIELAVIVVMAVALANLFDYGLRRVYGIDLIYPLDVLVAAAMGAALGLVLRRHWRKRRRQPPAD